MDTATEVKAGKSQLGHRWQPVLEIEGYRPTLRSRILMPYAVLAVALTITATIMVSGFVERVLASHLEGHLAARNEVVKSQIARLAGDHAAFWEFVSSSEPYALRSTLNSLSTSQVYGLVPGMTSVYVLDQDGSGLLRSGGAAAGGAEWTWLADRLPRAEGPTSGVRLSNDGFLYFTAGWLNDGHRDGGDALLILATPLAALMQDIAVQTLAGITIYGADGRPGLTTVGRSDESSLSLDATELDDLAGDGNQLSRLVLLDGKTYRQLVSQLPVDQAWLGLPYIGVAMVEEPIGTDVGRARLIILSILGLTIAGTLLVARASTDNIEHPIRDLMAASQLVAAGNLDVQVDIHSQDELGELAQSFNTMVKQLRQRRSLEHLLGRYVGDNIAQRLLDGDAELSGRRVWATSLFADIRDFSAFTQKVDLTELLDELNEYYETMQRVIDAHGGVVNKFGGDSILAIFGAPLPEPDHANKAIQAAVEMMDELSKLNGSRLMRGVAPIRIGIGVNTGEMIEGNLGSEKRREYTVLGDSVNLAKRLSDLNKETPFDTVFVGETTWKALQGARRWQIDDLGFVMVKGQVEPIRIFSVMHRSAIA